MIIHNHHFNFIYKIYAAKAVKSCNGGKDDQWMPAHVCEVECNNPLDLKCYNVSIFIML